MLTTFGEILKEFDEQITQTILKFVAVYVPIDNVAYFVVLLPQLIKYLFYCLMILLPILPLKLLSPYTKFLNWIIYFILAVMGVLLFGVFIGFFQLLWTS